ncbi:MAG: methylase involved in ubiquinone/menaquinone biosynthesis [Parachlamydiales bacterium]|nr:methylase involved in ubiquinone/menaquinone biosynthesis [Parachlamydiales bacterium]
MIKYGGPIQVVIKYLVLLNKNNKKILEIGPGVTPFPIATHFIDHSITGPNVVNLDICNEKLPFSDNEFDFVYARHVLEDVQNPIAAFKELVRVGKKGYIETPSVIAEVTRHIDGSSPPWRGYIHHRYLFWNVENELVCIPKYPFIEFIDIPDVTKLLLDPFNWNHYYQWDCQSQASAKELKHDIDYNISVNYKHIICQAVLAAQKTSQEFKNKVIEGGKNRRD